MKNIILPPLLQVNGGEGIPNFEQFEPQYYIIREVRNMEKRKESPNRIRSSKEWIKV